METRVKKDTMAPPKLIASLQAGFNTAANHLYLILFPILLDLILWLGPQINIRKVFMPVIDSWISTANQVGTTEIQSFFTANQAVLQTMLDQFNFATIFRTFPIGIPSLISSYIFDGTPLGMAFLVEVPSFTHLGIYFFALSATGLMAGAIYFSMVARESAKEKPIFSGFALLSHVIQSFILTFSLLVLLLIIAIPSFIFLAVLGMIIPGLAQFGGLILMFFLLWLLLPLVFSPHGIYAAGKTAFASIFTSVQLVRLFLPGTGVFIMVSLLLNEGLNIIWHIPPSNSWMTLIAILGHGFIVTALLSASFVYYQDGMKWMSDNLARKMKVEAPVS